MGCLLRATRKSRAGLAYTYADAGDAKVTRSARRIANGCCAARDETGSCRRTQCKPAGSSQRPSGSQPQFQLRAALHSTRKMLAGELEPHPPAHLVRPVRRLGRSSHRIGVPCPPSRGRQIVRQKPWGLRSHPGAQDRPHGFEGAADMRADAIARASARRAGEEFAEPSCQASACKSGVPPTT